MKAIKLIFTLTVFASLLGCQGGENRTNIELIQDMMDGPQMKTQEGSPDGKLGMHIPPKGAVSREFKPYPFKKSDIASADTLKNPMRTMNAQDIKELSAIGKEKYEIYCGVCHGNTGKGDGSIAKKMLKMPPNLTSDIYKAYSQGRIFNVVTNGWGLMGGYGSQVPEENERWAIVSYVRQLQGMKGGN